MAVSVLLCSSLTAFADTTVDSGGTFDKQFFNDLLNSTGKDPTTSLSLTDLNVDDYLVVFIYQKSSSNVVNRILFIPKSNKKYTFIETTSQNYYNDFKNYVVADDEILIPVIKDNNTILFRFITNSPVGCITFSKDRTSFEFVTFTYNHAINSVGLYSTTLSAYANHFFINDSTLYSKLNEYAPLQSFYNTVGLNNQEYPSTDCVPSLFAYLTQIIPGYTGSVKDNSLNGLISEYGKDCDTSILKQYKYHITYCQNNDIKMMFLNNNKAPKYTVTDYNGVYPISRKYTFTYENSYDCVVYFPQYQKYLNYDDWYNNKPEPNDFKWFWESDNKSFSLINDWTVTFNEGAPNYSGTRVIVGWEKSFNAASASMSDAWKIDKDKLINEGWIEGRPNDQNYPYQITIKQNGVPTFQIYMNSKPAIEVDRNNDFQCLYKIQMVPQCGYVYSFWADCYSKFDYTSRYSNGDDILSNVQNAVWNFWTEVLYMDEQYYVHLFENFRGSTDPQSTEYIGTKVFFNWDISSKMINKNDDDDYDYSQLVNTGDKYVDNNGNIHGGSLSNYDSEDLNKYNDNGSSDNNSTSSGNIDFSFEGITSYCSDFFNFVKSVFNLFPSFIWVLVGASIAVLIALRVLGR